MAEEKESAETKGKANSGLMVVMACMLLVVGMIVTGPLQYLIFAFSAVLSVYAAVIAAKTAKKKTGQL